MDDATRKLLTFYGWTILLAGFLGFTLAYYWWRPPIAVLPQGRFLLTTRAMGLYALLFSAAGFTVATFHLKYPYHKLMRFYYTVLLRKPVVMQGVISKLGGLDFDVVPKKMATLKEDKGYIHTPGGLGMLGTARGNVYFEDCGIALDLDPAKLSKEMQEIEGNMASLDGGTATDDRLPVGYTVVSSMYLKQFYDAFYSLAVKLAEARVKKETKWMLYGILVLVGFDIVIGILGYNTLSQLPRVLQALTAKIQATGYGIT